MAGPAAALAARTRLHAAKPAWRTVNTGTHGAGPSAGHVRCLLVTTDRHSRQSPRAGRGPAGSRLTPTALNWTHERITPSVAPTRMRGELVQHHFVGDVGDFGKYGLLRVLAGVRPPSEPRLALGVVWYVPAGSVGSAADGQKLAYLSQPHRFRDCDPGLFDALGRLVDARNRCLDAVEASGTLGDGTIFRDEPVPQDLRSRERWLKETVEAMRGRDIVFLDPDKGLAPPSAGPNSAEHAYIRELKAFVQLRQTVVVYHHLGRQAKHTAQMRGWAERLKHELGLDAKPHVLWYRKGTARAYFVIPADAHAGTIGERLQQFGNSLWFERRYFTPLSSAAASASVVTNHLIPKRSVRASRLAADGASRPLMTTLDGACATIRVAADTFRAAAISAAQAALESPHAIAPGLAADCFDEEIRAVADTLDAVADRLAREEAAVHMAEPLSLAFDALAIGLPSTVNSDLDTSRAVIEAGAAAFRAVAGALDGLPAAFDDGSLDMYQAAWIRASVRQVVHALDDLLAARVAYDEQPDEIHSNAETAAYSIVRDVAAVLAGDHSQLLRYRAANTRTSVDFARILDASYGERSDDDRQDRAALRVEDLHPWIAASAGPLFADGHCHAAVVAATQSLESSWRSLLGVEGRSFGELARMSFDPRDPTGDEPRLRIAGLQDSVALKTAQDHAQHLAKSAARLRNLAIHHPPDSEPPPTKTLTQLALLSELADLVTEAEIIRSG